MKKLIISIASSCICLIISAQQLAVSTNVIDYANLGTLNVAASVGVARHWSIDAGMKYNPFTFNPGDKAVQSRQQSYSAGARYWLWHIFSGWWLSGAIRYQEYNTGGHYTPMTSEGNRFGGGIGGGYTYMLSPHLNLDFGFKAWAGYDIYTTYACQTCGKIVSEGEKAFFLPSDIMLALSYLF